MRDVVRDGFPESSRPGQPHRVSARLSPARSPLRAAARPGRSRRHTPNQAGRVRSARRPAPPGPPRSRARRGPPSASASGSCSSRRSMTASPSAPPSSATTGSNDAAIGRPGIASRPDVRAGWPAPGRTGPVDRRRAGRTRAKSIASPTAWPTAFSRARSRASAEIVDGQDRDDARARPAAAATTASATAIAPLPVPTSTITDRRIGGRQPPRAAA